MNKGRGFITLIAVFTASVFLGFSANISSAKPIELTYTNFFPPTHAQSQLSESWCREVEKRTNGKVKFNYYPGGTLSKADKIFTDILDGIADMGTSVMGYTPGIFKEMETIDLPLGYPSAVAATQIINDFYLHFKPKSLDRVKVLYFHAHGPGILHSKTPVRKLEDLRGMKIRSTGFSAKVAESLGGVAVAMGQGGAYEALQKGVANATIAPIEVLKGWKQAEVIKYTTECYSIGYTTGFFVVMSLDKWNSLPADVQQVMEEVNREWVVKHGQAWDDTDREGREFTLSLGNEIIPLSPEESARWAKAVAPVVDEYVRSATRDGLPGQDYVDFIRARLEEYTK